MKLAIHSKKIKSYFEKLSKICTKHSRSPSLTLTSDSLTHSHRHRHRHTDTKTDTHTHTLKIKNQNQSLIERRRVSESMILRFKQIKINQSLRSLLHEDLEQKHCVRTQLKILSDTGHRGGQVEQGRETMSRQFNKTSDIREPEPHPPTTQSI